MGMTQAGPVCDICEKYILPIGDEMVNMFTDANFEGKLMSDNKCKELLQSGAKWWDLPPGHYRDCYERIHKEHEGHCGLGACPVCDAK